VTDASPAAVPEAQRQAALDGIAGEVAVCTRCRLHRTRTRAVPGEGTAATEVVFVGEGPGFNEDRQGRPFVGRAGDLLDRLLASVDWPRQEVFITNVVKCRPPENRDPEPDEIAACAPFLARQLEALDPALVVTLGRFSMARFNPGARIGQVHGTFRRADAASGAPDALTYAMYHPAAALRQGSLEATLFQDMAGVPQALLEARRLRAAPPQADATSASEPAAAAEPAGASLSEAAIESGADSTPAHSTLPDRGGPIPESDPTDQLPLF
jgi:uracil-DNA glycosylase